MPRADARGEHCACSLRSAPPATPRRRRFAALLAVLALVTAGCSFSDTAEDGDDAPSTEAAPVEPSGPEPEPPAREGSSSASDHGREEEPEPEDEPEPDPEPPPPPDGRDALIDHVQQMLAAALGEASTGELAVLVVDEHGREIAGHAADDALMPASTLKIVTAAAILTTLGPQHRITTTIETTSPIAADGTVDGDIVLVGAGDPVLATPEYARWVYPARPRTPLEELADQLVDAGVTRITGDVRTSAPGFSGPRVPDGWPDRYFSSFDARYSDGLTVDAGLRTIVTYPDADDDGDEDEAAAASELGDESSTESAVSEPPDDVEELGPPDVRVDHADEPSRQAAVELIRLLEERDVEVVGGPVDGEPQERIVGRLAAVRSPPMFDLLRFAVQRSDNHLTDGLFRLAARARTGDGSFASGDRALRQVLDRYAIDHGTAVFADGSGLSRDDRASARLLVELDRAMTASRHGAAWAAIMASMGESGTLERRLRGTIAEGRFLGKTGTLRDVTALNGAVLGPDGARYHLAVIANDEGATRGIARALTDELVLLLVADVDACETDRPGDDGPIGLPPLQVRC